MSEDFENESQRLDNAVSHRLSKLRSVPVDTSRLDAAIRRRIPRREPMVLRLFRPLNAVAASMLIVGLIAAILLSSSSGQVLASPAQMAQVHQDLIANRDSIMHVNSIDDAARVLAGSMNGSMRLPAPRNGQVMACCMKSIRDKKIACILLETDNKLVTLSVARGSDMRMPNAPSVERDGTKFFLQSYDSLNMVSANRQGHWVCLMGEIPTDRLVKLGAQLQF
jgi:anti-sigma factor RsiW